MASLFARPCDHVRILDAGAGAGALLAALVVDLCARRELPESIEVTAIDSDPEMIPHLERAMNLCNTACTQAGIRFEGIVRCEDFLSEAIAHLDDRLFAGPTGGFSHAILNPPYRKINSESHTRRLLNEAGLETTNLYAAFVWLCARLLQPGGEIVAITPRSFCNGPYFRRFRRSLLEMLSLRRIHLFESRKKAFADDSVLQENIIFYGTRGDQQPEHVTISVSTGFDFGQTAIRQVPFDQVVLPSDADSFIHVIEGDDGHRVMESMDRFCTTLDDLGLEVSTGRVVDFRAREFLHQAPEPGTVPLIYPFHFDGGFVRWPVANAKKPNAILAANETQTLLVEAGYYVLTKRFTAKEEPRRVVASIYDPNRIDAPVVGFENHLNYFHASGRGMAAGLAKGLAVFLNSSLFDDYFRLFSGHTQVNATDLRKMRYPSREQILRLGKWVGSALPEQQRIDTLVEQECRKDD
jgi:adenine-specific DNA-methyltransferase